MKFVFTYIKEYRWAVLGVILIKIAGTFTELMLPYILEHLIDDIAPTKNLLLILLWGGTMLVLAVGTRFFGIRGNRKATKIARDVTYKIRRDLFWRSLNLSGGQIDEFGLPSLTSRMTADTYNVQNFVSNFQSMGIRVPILLLGGIVVSLTMDVCLGLILCILAPIASFVAIFASIKGIALYDKVQQSVDTITRVMRENITGIRVVKALSKENYEMRRFHNVNEEMASRERKTAIAMSLPGPAMTLILNTGLTLIVFVGAIRVNSGLMKPGVILSFLTYFNMILMGVMGLNRVFLITSKATASANRISAVICTEDELTPLPDEQAAHTDSGAYILFDNVSFQYGKDGGTGKGDSFVKGGGFVGEGRQMSLENVSFAIQKGGSLGIIGPTGCGKTTIINLLMRFYDASSGHVFVDGKDVRTYDKDTLHRKFGAVFQNDVVFADTLEENISFGRDVSGEDLERAAADACAAEFINTYDDRFQHKASIHGANLSGGQRQRVLISRALAANPDILILDDASSALDYKTDAALRKAIHEHHSGATTITVAQRVSSIMTLDHILVMDEGRIIGQGTHEELLRSCPQYHDIYKTQMGEE